MGSATDATVHVLVVDDDPDAAGRTADALEAADERLTAETATGPSAARERIDEGVDCVVTEYDLEGDGLSFLESVRAAFPALPVVVYTDRGSELVASDAVAAGATQYVPKKRPADEAAPADQEGDATDRLATRVLEAVGETRTSERARTERERALQRERKRFSALFENFPEPTIAYEFVGDEPLVRAVNAAFEETFGYDAAAAVDTPIDDLVVPPEKMDEARDIDRRVRAGEFVDEELRRQAADGTRYFKFRNIPIPVEDGPDGFGVYIDIHDRKERERDIERQNERLEEFSTIVSHDLRNPLTVATDALALAREECESPQLERVDKALGRMDALTEDLLALARQGETVGEIEAVALARTVRNCWETVGATDATVRVPTDLRLEADPGRLRQLLENLLRNAVDHGGPDVTVTVGTLSEGEGFYVADDGPGIPPDERDAVFEGGYTTRADGTGYGLTIVEEVATAHGWSVTVTESAEGGARFEIRDVTPLE